MPDDLQRDMTDMAVRARRAASVLAMTPGSQRRDAVHAMARELRERQERVLHANDLDVADARAKRMPTPLVKRLAVSSKALETMVARLDAVAALPDPVGRLLEGHTRPNGLRVERVSVPIGVIAMVYEARPNVTTDAAAVAVQSANAVLLRGGSEALRTNTVLAEAMIAAVVTSGLPEAAVQIVRTADREAVHHLLQLDQYIDVLIPRGGKSLVQKVSEASRVPVIKHYEGICHLYLAADAATDTAVALSVNSKCQRVEVCNALETLLVDAQAAPRLLPELARAFARSGVELRGCPRVRQLLPGTAAASEEDWACEYLAPILSIKVVADVREAIDHINTYGSGHTDGIVTDNLEAVRLFVAAVDSASVLVNASTRLSGGADYGLGAVVGISTDKLHARGPVGSRELTSYKWVAYGTGHLRD